MIPRQRTLLAILFLLPGCSGLSTIAPEAARQVVLARDGRFSAAIYVAPRDMEPDREIARTPTVDFRSEEDRRRLRDSVRDLAHYLGRIVGGEIEIRYGPLREASEVVPILIGGLARQRFGPVGLSGPFEQALRVVVRPDGIGLYGESDLSSSYAIFTLLDRLGCRWYIPGELGEVIPRKQVVSLPIGDSRLSPATDYRDLWYRDRAFARRNRLGGLNIRASHALERYVTREQREAHPEWCALIDGKRDPARPQLSWGSAGAAEAVAAEIIRRLDADYEPSVSLSPIDTTVFGGGPEELALDTGDWDSTMQRYSLTDRLLSFANRIAERVSAKHPKVRLGLLAYVQYTRPPLRVKPHPNLVIKLAPITYNRAHPMTDDRHPTSALLREIVSGWGRVTEGRFSCYPYAYNLGEVSAPFPMIRRWSADLPILFANGCKFFQPETMPNFETSLHGLYLGMRLAWDPSQDAAEILEELNRRFYGAAAPAMTEYWDLIDRAWTETPEYAGNFWGFSRRFTPELLRRAADALDRAKAAAKSAGESNLEFERVELVARSFAQLELLMRLRRNLLAGMWSDLGRDSQQWIDNHLALGGKYAENYAFTAVPAKQTKRPLAVRYFERFLGRTYKSAARLANEAVVVTPEPVRRFRYRTDPEDEGLRAGWAAARLDTSSWGETDSGTETWSSLGLYDYFGTLWYRAELEVDPAALAGKRVFLWVSGAAGAVNAYVNGEKALEVDDDGVPKNSSPSYAVPLEFDITGLVGENGTISLAFRTRREGLDELGVGGLLGPVTIYRQP